jgi:hypothetical protein
MASIHFTCCQYTLLITNFFCFPSIANTQLSKLIGALSKERTCFMLLAEFKVKLLILLAFKQRCHGK